MNDKMKMKAYIFAIVILMICQGLALQETVNAACPTPLIFESLNGFKLPLNDVAELLTNQYSRNTLSNINAPNKVYLTNIAYQSRLLSDDQSESCPTPLSAIVYNDKIEFEINYTILITEGTIPKNHTFIAKTKISNVMINYRKEYILESGSFQISNVNLKLEATMFTTTFDKQPDSKETEPINNAIKGTTNSLFATFTKLLAVEDVARYMQSNTKKQPLSAVYKENPYNYQFDNGRGLKITIPVDTTTTWFNASSETQVTNGMSGMLPSSNTFCSNFVPNFTQYGGQLFVTKELIQNFIEYNLIAFNGWQQIRIDKTTIRSTILQWQLLDLDYVVDNLWTDLYSVSENEIYFTCSAKENLDTKLIDTKGPKLHQTLKWSCSGFVKLNATDQQKVIEFNPTIDHIIDLQVSQGSITPYVNVLQLIDVEFKDVPSLTGQTVYKFNQNNLKLAQKLIQSVFNDFRTYPVGNRFWVGEKATKISIEDQTRGFWVY